MTTNFNVEVLLDFVLLAADASRVPMPRNTVSMRASDKNADTKILFFVFVMLFLLINFDFDFVFVLKGLRRFLLTLICFLLLPMHIGYLLKERFIKIRLSFLVRQAISI